jgi:curli biogenesis system outer membrane secretion channel CsgG
MAKKLHFILFILLCTLSLSACGQNSAASTAENYIHALVDKDASRLSALSCADWEPSAQMELDSFQSIAVRLEGLACTAAATENGATQVTCQGKIIATYNNEDEQFDLSVRSYRIINQGGEFLMCGYQ